MYKLTVVAGPNRGASYAVQDGEMSIGRQNGNEVVLPSAKVSKRHCVLVVSDGKVIVSDQGSANGTFVNGVLTKSKSLKAGDRISVGEYVLELSEPPVRAPRAAPAIAGLGGNVLQFPGSRLPMGGLPGLSAPGGSGADSNPLSSDQPPKDLRGKVIWAFERHLMPFFYTLNLKHEWKVICVTAMGALAVGNLVFTVAPLLDQNRTALIREMARRAQFMARQIAERNGPALAERAETKTEIGSIDRAEGVRVALLTDLDSRIIAPASKVNQYLTSGGEAILAVKAKRWFLEDHESGLWSMVGEDLLCAIEPVRVLSNQAGKNVTVGMAIVSIDTSLATPDWGEMGMTYSETLIMTGLLGGLILLILYRLTLKPFDVLNEDMDKVLKGDMPDITHEFKFEEMNPLFELIKSALQRIPKGDAAGLMGGGFGGGLSAEELSMPFRMIGNVSKYPIMICDGDRKILFINTMFEDASGIRSENALGQDVAAVARDQSLGQFTSDLFERAMPGTEGVAEDYDFSGVSYRCHVACVGSNMGKCYVFAAIRVEG